MKTSKSTNSYIQKLIVLFFFLILVLLNLNAQQLAFPSAKGAGAYSVGGRGGQVVHVTNLNDSGPGSFRWALTDASFNGVDRTIVFDVSGVIELLSTVDTNGNGGANITIAGFTAPRGGITLIGYPVRGFGWGDLIIRGIKARNGYVTDGSSTTALGFSFGGVKNHIRDHMSYAFSNKQAQGLNVGDAALGYGGTNQNSLTYFAGQGAIIGTANSNGATPESLPSYFVRKEQTWYRNLLVDSGWRNPNVHGITSADIINNIYFNWNKHISSFGMSDYNAGETQKINHISNYAVANNQTLTAGSDCDAVFKTSGFNGGFFEFHLSDFELKHATPITGNTIFTGSCGTSRVGNWDPNDGNTNYWLFDERSDGAMTVSVLNDVIDNNPDWFNSTQHPLLGNLQQSDILTASQLKDSILPTVGAVYYTDDNGEVQFERDLVDQWAINRVINEENTFKALPDGGLKANFAPKLKLGGAYELPHNTRPVNFYGVNQHIPTAWLTRNGYADTIDIHNQVEPDGYTVLEHYINQVDNIVMGNVEATGLNLSPDVATLNVSETLELNVQFTPANTTDQSGVWTSENEAVANVDTNGTVTGIAEGVVEIRFVSNDGGFTDTSVINVVPMPVVADAGEDQNICEGESVLLTATGGTNFLWSTGDSTQSITVSPNSTTTYSVTVSNGSEEDSDEVIVFVDSLPNLTVSEDVTIIEGESTTISANGATEYLWDTGQNTSAITVSPNVTTTYTVTGTNGACEAQAQITVTVEEIFVADAGDDEFICEGSGDIVTLTAGDGDNYLWSTGETTQSINVSPSTTSTYSVTITSGVQEDSDDVTVFVDPNPNVVILNGDSVDILNGDFITLSATGANSYEWSNGATQPNIAVSPSLTTTYQVRGYINDCYDEKQVTVNVFEPVQAYAGEDVRICLNETATLTATGGDEFLWSTGETAQSIQVAPFQTTVYTVTVFNALDFDEASVTVEVDNFCDEEITNNQNDDTADMSFKVYPNPAYNYVNLRLNGSMDLTNVFIYDFMGKLVQKTQIENESQTPVVETRMNITSLSNGIYFIKLVDKSGYDLTKKLIVR